MVREDDAAAGPVYRFAFEEFLLKVAKSSVRYHKTTAIWLRQDKTSLPSILEKCKYTGLGKDGQARCSIQNNAVPALSTYYSTLPSLTEVRGRTSVQAVCPSISDPKHPWLFSPFYTAHAGFPKPRTFERCVCPSFT